MTKLSLEDGSVARIISLDTLEHIEDCTLAVSEMYRVLCDNGLAILHVPCYYFEKPVGEPIRPGIDPFGHVRYFSARELLTALDKAGFIILRAGFHLDYGALLCVAAKNSTIKNKHS
ncbi:MAG: methyltransferase domain-containing protein [Planctomycetota bacterium]